jgi:rifampicin phosphotransferase
VNGFVALAAAGEPAAHGNKAAGLARVRTRVSVPDGLLVPGSWLTHCLDHSTRARLVDLLRRVDDADEPALDRLTAELDALLQPLRPNAERAGALLAASTGLGPLVVVRSSSSDEDSANLSFAGVFDSLVDVAEADIVAAVWQVWCSGFGARALRQYRRIGRAPRIDHLSVLVQHAIRPVTAGVAFSEPSGDAYVEWVSGHGADLMGGLAVPTGERLDRRTAVDGWRARLSAALVELSRDGSGHDVEWAWDGERLWVVQVRPRTAVVGAAAPTDGLRVSPLYEGDQHDLLLGDCAEDYTRIRAKRRLPRAIALAEGASVPGGWLVNWDTGAAFDALAAWSAELPARVVVDSSPTQRQYILTRAELPDTVRMLADGIDGVFAFLCREYIHGELALLSTVAADGSVYVEASDEGLLAVNRGFGEASPVDAEQLDRLVGAAQAAALTATSRQHARRLHPRAVLEWVISDGRLIFVDYSAPSTGAAGAPTALGGRVLSAGLASGRVRHLDIDDALTESSIAPIISIAQPVSATDEALLVRQLRDRLRIDPDSDGGGDGLIVAVARPIAVLSLLIGQVDGFVFEEGALLSHLGILLREAGVPAAIVGTGNLPPEDCVVDLVHGAVLTGSMRRH